MNAWPSWIDAGRQYIVIIIIIIIIIIIRRLKYHFMRSSLYEAALQNGADSPSVRPFGLLSTEWNLAET